MGDTIAIVSSERAVIGPRENLTMHFHKAGVGPMEEMTRNIFLTCLRKHLPNI